MARVYLLVLLLIALIALPAEAGKRKATAQPQNSTTSEQDVLHDFEQILDLWRDGRYDQLFDRTSSGKKSREEFAKTLASAPRKPACCWEKMQEARVSLEGDRKAVVSARLGFEGGVSGTEYVTKAIKLSRQDSLWVISQADLLSLANVSKRRVRYKYLPIQNK